MADPETPDYAAKFAVMEKAIEDQAKQILALTARLGSDEATLFKLAKMWQVK